MKGFIVAGAVITSFILTAPTTGFTSVGVNVQIDGYLPAPPGVHISVDAGRPYYVEHDRRVYIEKRRKHDNGKHRGHGKHEDQGRKKGHGNKGKHD